jgi:hypothetical protein
MKEQDQNSRERRGLGGSCTIASTCHRATVFLNNPRTKKHLRLQTSPTATFFGCLQTTAAHQPTKQSTASSKLASVLAAVTGP